MQNRYVGDIGDFGKYGLLRFLSGMKDSLANEQHLRISVVWYLHPDESHNSDGKHIGYLNVSSAYQEALRECDPDLYNALRKLVYDNARRVTEVRHSCILPADTAYYERSLSFPRSASRRVRQATRNRWLQGALEIASEAELIFVDPDNGISITADPLRKNGPKFVYMNDLWQFRKLDKSLVIYHHLGRRGTATEQILKVSECLQDQLQLEERPWALRFRRGSARVYFIIPHKPHRAALAERVSHLIDSSWGAHFDLV